MSRETLTKSEQRLAELVTAAFPTHTVTQVVIERPLDGGHAEMLQLRLDDTYSTELPSDLISDDPLTIEQLANAAAAHLKRRSGKPVS